MKIKLQDVCRRITDGSHNPPNGIEQSEFYMLSSKNVFDDSITLEDPRFLSEDEFKVENKRTEIESDDLLMTIVGTVGRVAVVPEEFPAICLQRSVAVIKPIKDKINSRYLMYQIQSMRTCFENEAHGVAQKGIYLKQLSNVSIQCPSLNEQCEIVSILDKLQSVISNRKQQLEKLDELVKARFVEMFGDPQKNTQNRPTTELINVVKMQRGFDLPTYNRNQNGDIPVYGANGALDRHDTAKVLGGGVITGRSGTIGNVYYTLGDYWPLNTSLFSSDLHGNNVIYLAYLLDLFDLTRFKEGTGVPTLNRNKFHKEQIIVVPITQQTEFAAFVAQTDKSKFHEAV